MLFALSANANARNSLLDQQDHAPAEPKVVKYSLSRQLPKIMIPSFGDWELDPFYYFSAFQFAATSGLIRDWI
jgi:hypothetical protein